MGELTQPPAHVVTAVIDRSLTEDLGRAGDITSAAVVPTGIQTTARIVARSAGRVAGIRIASQVFTTVDADLTTTIAVDDSDDAAAGATLGTVTGAARSILAAERTALNLLGHLSGIATATRDVVRAIEGTGARVVDTRKTTPGLRAVEKFAVRAGGGANHRMGLDDAVLIKDNHLAVAGSVSQAVTAARAAVGHTVKIEVEVEDLDGVVEAVEAGADIILLDNMTPQLMQDAVALVAGRAVVEASGGITPDTARSVAETGVDLLSMGWITHSAPNLDVALDIDL